MLTVTRTNQQWTAKFSNGGHFNREATAPSPIAALRGLARELPRYASGPMVQLMADTVNAIADNTQAGEPLPSEVDLAEYYYRRVA